MDHSQHSTHSPRPSHRASTARGSDADPLTVAVHVKLEKFEGPFDLLVQLLEKEQLSINEISLVHVTEQYLAHLQKIESTSPEHLADFLGVATRLVLMKSRSLLPFLEAEEESEGDLAEQLRMYQAFVAASEDIRTLFTAPQRIFERPPQKIVSQPTFSPPPGLNASDLAEVLKRFLQSLKPILTLPQQMMEKTVSLQEKMRQLVERITKLAQTSFREMIQNNPNRSEVVVTFLALLELVKQQTVTVKQHRLFQDIEIHHSEVL